MIIYGCQKNDSELNIEKGGRQSNKEMGVVYRIPEMESVRVKRNIEYKVNKDSTLVLDLYIPPNANNEKLPVVLFSFGFDTNTVDLRNHPQYVSWAKLIAASGLIAVTYETINPSLDIGDVINFLRENSDSLKVDREQISIWACSANVPVAMKFILQNNFSFLKSGVFYYGFMPIEDLKTKEKNNTTDSTEIYDQYLNIESITNKNLPLLVVRAGLDSSELINQTIDEFLIKSNNLNLPVTFINNPSGQHGFDIYDDNNESREIVKYTIEYIKNKFLIVN